MKQFHLTGITIALLLLSVAIKAQQVREVSLSTDKTTSIIFPYPIRSVDKGTRDILAQKVKNADTVLQLKAARPGFTETNVTVITADGVVYTFLVHYDPKPDLLPLYIPREAPAEAPPPNGADINAAAIEAQAFEVEQQRSFLHVRTSSQQMKLALKATHISEQVLWLTLQLSNTSQVAFRPDYLRFFLADRERSKRTAVQQTELTPLFVQLPMVVRAGVPVLFAVGFTPFTVPSDKYLIIQVGEKAAGRSLLLKVPAKAILKARQLQRTSN